ncbi:BA75_02948T0 [Komagataella pastoris]|uniref:alpha,alpha-trehalase n=1 Tax=Komagataella pastoris TaxID=4922 RepID=A0A1B2JD16_PICPA|nr:BA75_02948T0 [Komagataella pastoris]
MPYGSIYNSRIQKKSAPTCQTRKMLNRVLLIALSCVAFFHLVKTLPIGTSDASLHIRNLLSHNFTRTNISEGLSSGATYFVDEDTETYYDKELKVLRTTRFPRYNSYQLQPYVANGYIGSRIPRVGSGFTYDTGDNKTSENLKNGWPLFNKRYSGAFIAGFFNSQPTVPETNFEELEKDGYESIIASIPQWTTLELTVNVNGTNQTLKANDVDTTHIRDYSQQLSLLDGIVTTNYTWLGLVNVSISVLAHRDITSLGLVSLELVSQKNITVYVTDVLDFETSTRCSYLDSGVDEHSIFMKVRPSNVPTNATIYSSLMSSNSTLSHLKGNQTVSQTLRVNLSKNQSASLQKYVGVVSDDYLESIETNLTSYQFARETAKFAERKGHSWILKSHKEGWKELIGGKSIIFHDNDFLTLASDSSIYHLMANTRAEANGGTSALGVSGLSSDSYGGMVFWDTDFWMLPSVQAFSPRHAVSLSKFRDHTHGQAKKNAETRDMNGAVYPWTSGRFGNCTSTGPCYDYEYHINIDIAFMFWKLYLGGAIDDGYMKEFGYPVIEDVASFFVDYVDYNSTLEKYTTRNLTDPDEYAEFKDNAAFTNVGISQLMKWALILGKHLNVGNEKSHDKWKDIMTNMYLPVNHGGDVTLEYTGMNNSIEVKQADVVLISYPLDDEDGALQEYFDYDEDRAISDVRYYSDKQTDEGPAMTFSIYSAVNAKFNKEGCSSQTYLLKSVEPYFRFPFGQMSEQSSDEYDTNGGTHPAFPFLTGHGAFLQSSIYGLTGLRFSYIYNDTDNSIKRRLAFDPLQLPCLPGGFSITGFVYMNQTLDISVNDTYATIAHRGNATTIYVYVDSRNEMGGKEHNIQPGKSLSIPLYRPEQNIPGSFIECTVKNVTALQPGVVGDPIQAVADGDNSTIWKIESREEPTHLVFDLGDELDIEGGLVVWGTYPAESFSVSVLRDFNSTNYRVINNIENYDLIYESGNVTASSPFDESHMKKVQILTHNCTNFSFSELTASRFVLFEFTDVLGHPQDYSYGAQVAEVVLY